MASKTNEKLQSRILDHLGSESDAGGEATVTIQAYRTPDGQIRFQADYRTEITCGSRSEDGATIEEALAALAARL